MKHDARAEECVLFQLKTRSPPHAAQVARCLECTAMRDGSMLLAENHCPICAAASTCQGLCREELSLFRAVLGDKARVERTDHILAGARRCAYRITAADG